MSGAKFVSDDGKVILGHLGNFSSSAPSGNFGAFIMKADQDQTEMYVDAFPACYEELGESDLLGQNIPTGISADG